MAIKTTQFEVYPKSLSVLEYLDSLSDRALYLLVKGEDIGTRPQPPTEHKYGKVTDLFRSLVGAKTNRDLSSEYSTTKSKYLINNALYNQQVDFVNDLRKAYHQDFRRLISLLNIEPTSIKELDASYRNGYVSKAELDFFKLLQKRLSVSNKWNLWHQVSVPEIDHKVDILICWPPDHFFVIEFDGPNHCQKWRFSKDSDETEQMRKSGFNVIRVGLQRFIDGKMATLDRIFSIVNGNDPPNQDFLGDQTVIEASAGTKRLSKTPIVYQRSYEKDANAFHSGATLTKCFLYCQTTGVGPRDQVIDIALLFSLMGRPTQEFYSKIRPSCQINPNAARLHSLTTEKVEHSRFLQDLIRKSPLKDILSSNPQLITYDWAFLEPKILNALDKKAMAEWKKCEKHSLVNDIRERYGLDISSTINDALDALMISKNKYKRYDSREYAKLMKEMYTNMH